MPVPDQWPNDVISSFGYGIERQIETIFIILMSSKTINGGFSNNIFEADAGTIRADFADSISANAVHGSDSLENAATEIALFFPEHTAVCSGVAWSHAPYDVIRKR